jgi:ATP-dependent DNA helicase RecG
LRNPLLAEILFKSKEIEKWGSGLKRIYEECAESGVKIEFEILKSGFMAIFYRREKEGSVWESREKIKTGTNEKNSTADKEKNKTSTKTSMKTSMKTSEMIITFIKDNPSISIAELARLTGLTRQGAAWNIDKLKKKGILKRVGPAKGGHWEVIETISAQKHL